MRPVSSLAVCLMLGAQTLAAQTRESIDVRVIELEATVLDRKGQPVQGLTLDDFKVRVGKRDVPVTNFYAVRDGKVLADDTPSAPPKEIATETSIPTSLVIFIDDRHLSQRSHSRAMEALKKYVSANVGASTIATLMRYDRSLEVRIRPTERPGPILREIEAVAKSPVLDEIPRERTALLRDIDETLMAIKDSDGRLGPQGETPETLFYRIQRYAEQRSSDIDHTLRALEEAIEVASAFTGRKVLLYVSDGLPQTAALEVFEYWDRALMRTGTYIQGGVMRGDSGEVMRFDRTSAFRRLAQTAQRANVSIFSFDAAGLRGEAGRSADHMSTLGSLNTTSMHANQRSGLQFVAEETGGLYVANENDIDKVLARISEQFKSYYSIGIRPPGGSGEIRVTVKNRPDLRVIAARRSPPRTREDKLEQSLRSRLYTRTAENPLNVTLKTGVAMLTNGVCVVPIRVLVPQPQLPPDLTPQTVEFRMVMLNEQNDESAIQTATLPFIRGEVHHPLRLRIRPERLVLSTAVSNPMSDETSYLQADVDGTTCR
ncbi:MAG TPA: VWA domain-containing protein [Thermoanaerobaculia bacterium]